MADIGGAERAVSAVLALLLGRERGGGERYAEVALSDAAEAFAGPWVHGLTGPDGPVGGGLPAYGFYEALGGWVAVAAIEPHFQARLREELGLPDLERRTLGEAFRDGTPAEWEAWAAARGLPIVAAATRTPSPASSPPTPCWPSTRRTAARRWSSTAAPWRCAR